PTPGKGMDLATGAFVLAGLAGTVAAALLLLHRRRRRAYRPGSDDQEPLPPLAPVVHALRLADDQTRMEDEAGSAGASAPDIRGVRSPEVELAVIDGHASAADVAALHGLGLTGAGAEAAVRALLIHLVADTGPTVFIPRPDAIRLLGPDLPESSRLRITPDLDTAIAAIEDSPPGSTALVASVPGPHPQLEALLADTDRHVIGVLLGHWPAGGTLRIGADGIVTAASPILTSLVSARMFHLDAQDTRDLITLFAEATGPTEEPSSTPETTEPSRQEQPAPALDDLTDDSSDHARKPFALSLLGRVSLYYRQKANGEQDLTERLAPKQRALLVFLALHPQGTTREVVHEALWPHAGGRRPFNAYYATLSQIRKALKGATGNEDDLLIQHGEHIGLNPEVIEVDYWHFEEANHARRNAGTDEERVAAWARLAALYHGDLAEDLTALWIEGPREAAHRSALDALAGLAAHYRTSDPHRRLQLLEHARLLSAENEDIYRDIMRVQAELGMTDAISRTYHLLASTLAKTGDRPAADTTLLARALQAEGQRRRAEASSIPNHPS
uniref:AfsR/SARP family transcriptional regulator n=1 Tax=Amycolatopsis sacchari TaxID=115433 RepID=UPI003EB7D1C1